MVQFKVKEVIIRESFWQVSIPKWCNSKELAGNQVQAFFFVSIPKWCNSKQPKLEPSPKRKKVSIPKWCNSKITSTTIIRMSSLFQFQNGAIQSNSNRLGDRLEASFNSKMVQFKVRAERFALR